jgi:hypothetical protein
MSHYDWERGTIKLPTAEFARVRQAVEKADREGKERVFAEAQTFWKGLTRKQQTDPGEYERAKNDRVRALHDQADKAWREDRQAAHLAVRELDDALSRVVRPVWDGEQRRSLPSAPRRILVADMDYPTNRTTRFALPSGATLTFDRERSSVEWDSGDNNHQVERAPAAPLAQAFFTALGTVRWTRGTGGILLGNDEYHEEAGRSHAGAGGSYVTAGWGPVGAADPDAFSHTDAYTDSNGHRVRPEDFPGRKERDRMFARVYGGGGQGRVGKGVRTGGQFTSTVRQESGVRLR